MSNTLRNNVLFGLTYDRQWYEMVIAACSLEQDLIELPNGDATIIGDKGVNLSGGQKARVGLARARTLRLTSSCWTTPPQWTAMWATTVPRGRVQR